MLILSASGCKFTKEEARADWTRQQLSSEKEILLQKGRLAEWAINNNKIDTLLADFWRSDSTFFLLNGRKTEGFENICRVFEREQQGTKIHIKDDKVIMLSPVSGIHMAAFDQIIVAPSLDTMHYEGVWTAHFKKIEEDWKWIGVNESYRSIERHY